MILLIADIHIKLGQKNVPKSWQKNRFTLLAQEINKVSGVSRVIIAGDLLDVPDPSIEEVGLMYDFLNSIEKPIILIPGNHELVSNKEDCFKPLTSMLKDLGVECYYEFTNAYGIDFIPYNILKDKEWPKPLSKYAVTHVRGEIPPHVSPEVDLSKFAAYEKVFAGDLHSYKNSQGNILYPGSPMVTSFHRNEIRGANGYLLIDENTFEHTWVELELPQLIRKTVTSEDEMVPTTPHHTIYELEGSMEDLRKVKNTELLDKRVAKGISTPATLQMTGDINQEVAEFLTQVYSVDSVEPYLAVLKDIINE